MHALKKVIGVVTFAALSLSGSATWAAGGNSFVAKAKLNGFNVVPPILTLVTTTLTITFRKPTTIEATVALAQRRRQNPWAGLPDFGAGNNLDNIRVYFDHRVANGVPILTLCDNDFTALGVPSCGSADMDEFSRDFTLDRIQFQANQVDFDPDTVPPGIDVACNQLINDEDGFKTIRDLIKRGLIYIVVNSKFEAAKLSPPPPDPENPDPDACTKDTIIYTPRPGIGDGDLRGTLRLVE